MNPKETPELTVQALMMVRRESDAVRVITERLRVKEMGPADHIRTKHEVKAFIEAGDIKSAELLLKRANERRTENVSIRAKVSLRRGHNIGQ